MCTYMCVCAYVRVCVCICACVCVLAHPEPPCGLGGLHGETGSMQAEDGVRQDRDGRRRGAGGKTGQAVGGAAVVTCEPEGTSLPAGRGRAQLGQPCERGQSSLENVLNTDCENAFKGIDGALCAPTSRPGSLPRGAVHTCCPRTSGRHPFLHPCCAVRQPRATRGLSSDTGRCDRRTER